MISAGRDASRPVLDCGPPRPAAASLPPEEVHPDQLHAGRPVGVAVGPGAAPGGGGDERPAPLGAWHAGCWTGWTCAVPVGARLLLVSEPDDAASMLLRILAGLVRPSAGSFDLAGVPRSDEADAGWRRRIGYVGREQGFYPWLSPREVLDLAGRLADYDRAERRRRIDAAIEQYRLGPGLDKPISRGGPATGPARGAGGGHAHRSGGAAPGRPAALAGRGRAGAPAGRPGRSADGGAGQPLPGQRGGPGRTRSPCC